RRSKAHAPRAATSRRGSTRRPAPRPGAPCSTRIARSCSRDRSSSSSWCAQRRARMTSTGWSRRRGSSRPSAVRHRLRQGFREAERLPIVQDMILANDTAGRKRALAKLLPFQQGDFREMYEAMDGLSVVIRLIDPPLHEFLREYADVDIDIAVAKATGQNGA